MEPSETSGAQGYPVTFEMEYPEGPLNRLTTAFRIFVAIPILIIISTLGAHEAAYGGGAGHSATVAGGTAGVLAFGPALMIIFRQKYPRWWFDWNLEFLRFSNRVGTYLALMTDHYPSTDEQQAVSLDFPYPDAKEGLNRWLPIVKWLLAIPHYLVLVFLWIGAFFAVIFAWFAILFTGRYPDGLFNYVRGVFRWTNRVVGYAVILVTDEYPPFRLSS